VTAEKVSEAEEGASPKISWEACEKRSCIPRSRERETSVVVESMESFNDGFVEVWDVEDATVRGRLVDPEVVWWNELCRTL